MATLVFDNIPLRVFNGTINLELDNFYIHLVTSEPASSIDTASGLALVTGGNYTALDLAGKQISAISGGGVKLTFTNPSWTSLYAGSDTPIVGGVICKKAGGSFAGTDQNLSYLAIQAPYTPSNASPGQPFTFEFSSDGVLVGIRQ